MRKVLISAGKRQLPLPGLLLFVLCLISILFSPASALQTPPDRVVNHETKQCALLFRGSVCTTCVPPEGWIVFSRGPYGPCPAGYRQVEIKPVCYSSRTSFCCTEGHSGAPGSCEDLVVNRSKNQCAFVADLKKCKDLPEGWLRPEKGKPGGNFCPLKYQWLEQNLQCGMSPNH